MMDDSDTYADGLLNGTIPVSGNMELQRLLDQVKMGQMSVEDFKKIIKETKMGQLRGVT